MHESVHSQLLVNHWNSGQERTVPDAGEGVMRRSDRSRFLIDENDAPAPDSRFRMSSIENLFPDFMHTLMDD